MDKKTMKTDKTKKGMDRTEFAQEYSIEMGKTTGKPSDKTTRANKTK